MTLIPYLAFHQHFSPQAQKAQGNNEEEGERSNVPSPLSSQTILQRNDRCFTDIIPRLRLREIDPMSRDTRREHNAPTSPLLTHMLRSRLRAKKTPRRVDLQRATPLLGRHLHCMHATYYACETEQQVDGSHGTCRGGERLGYQVRICHIDGDGGYGC